MLSRLLGVSPIKIPTTRILNHQNCFEKICHVSKFGGQPVFQLHKSKQSTSNYKDYTICLSHSYLNPQCSRKSPIQFPIGGGATADPYGLGSSPRKIRIRNKFQCLYKVHFCQVQFPPVGVPFHPAVRYYIDITAFYY